MSGPKMFHSAEHVFAMLKIQ